MSKKIKTDRLYNSTRSTLGLADRLPQATKDNLKEIANRIFTGAEYRPQLNDFIITLIDKVGLTLFRENKIRNEFDRFVYYGLDFGDVIEEIFTQPAQAENYEPNGEIKNNSSIDPYRITVGEVKALYIKNTIKRKYRVTRFESQLRKTFYSEYGLYNMLAQLADSLIQGANLDARYMFKEVLNQAITNNVDGLKLLDNKNMYTNLTTTVQDKETAINLILDIKNKISDMLLPTGEYNSQGAIQQLTTDDIVVFLRKDIASLIQTQVLSSAFNKDELDFTPAGYQGKVEVMLVDDFGGIEPWNSDGSAKLVIKYDEYGKFIGYTVDNNDYTGEVTYYNNYMQKTPSNPPKLNVTAMICDKRLPIIAIQKDEMYTTFNGEAIYTNTVLHRWATYGYSAFANYFVIFEPHKDYTP